MAKAREIHGVRISQEVRDWAYENIPELKKHLEKSKEAASMAFVRMVYDMKDPEVAEKVLEEEIKYRKRVKDANEKLEKLTKAIKAMEVGSDTSHLDEVDEELELEDQWEETDLDNFGLPEDLSQTAPVIPKKKEEKKESDNAVFRRDLPIS